MLPGSDVSDDETLGYSQINSGFAKFFNIILDPISDSNGAVRTRPWIIYLSDLYTSQ